MYGQGNFGPQFGQGSNTSVPPIQQHRQAPPPPPPPFQQGPSAPCPNIVQQGPPLRPHGGPPVQCYLNPHSLPPPPPLRQMHGSTPMAHSYSSAQQNFQWTQNVHHIPPPVPPPFGTLAPRVLPPPPSQGQAPYRDMVHPSSSGGVQGLQHTPPPPPPPPVSSFLIPSAFESFEQQPATQDSHIPSMGFLPPPPPPPPPSSPPPGPPPLPPSSPLPNSPQPCSRTPSAAPIHSESCASSNKHSGQVADSVDRALAPHLITDDASSRDVLSNFEGGTNCELVSVVEHGLSYGGNSKLVVPPPPPRPTDEKIVRKIEVLCQYIAKNGPDFEDMTLQKEFGNPEFEFLFGGEPGSEAEAAHEYFVWMKKRCSLTCKLHDGQQHNDSISRPSRNDTSLQPDSLIEAGVPPSPADSDMDMEDDITQPVEEHRIYKSFESPTHGLDIISRELDKKEHYAAQNTAGHTVVKDDISGSVEHVKGSNLSLDYDNSTIRRPLTVVDMSVMNPVEDAEFPSDSNLENSVEVPSQLSNGATPFRLLQDYDSDDSSENEDVTCLEDVCPATVATSVKEGDDASLDVDMGSEFQMDIGSKGLLGSEKGFTLSKSLDSSIESETIVTKADLTSIETRKVEQIVDNSHGNQESIDSGTSPNAFKQKNASGGTNAGSTLESGKSQKEDARHTSTSLKVDEFGRLVREGASDSDSDDVRYTKRRGKRGRSWSRSRSPHDRRRRSPRRRKEKRSRSRSWSPKKRGRSRSPLRRGGEFGGEKARRDKGQLPDCFDFRRGKCYRGASCRYLHHDSDKSDGSRHSKSKQQQYQEVPPPSSKLSERSTEQLATPDQDGKTLANFAAESERAQEVTEALDIEKELVEPPIDLTDADARILPGETSVENLWIQQSEVIRSDAVHQNSNNQPQQVDNLSASDVTGSLSKPHSSESIPSHPSLLPPPPPSVSHGTDAPFPPQLSGYFNMMQSSQAPILYQHSHFSTPPNISWQHSLPPPPPLSSHPPYVNNLTMNAATASQGVFQPSVRPYLAELPARSQVGEFQHLTYPPMHESGRPLSQQEDIRPSTLPVTNPMTQQFGGPSLVGEDRFTRIPMQSLNSSNSFAQGNMHQQPMPFVRESPVRRMQSFFGDNVYNTHMGEQGKINSTLSRYSSDFLDRNQSSLVPEFGGSRIPNHYNPYASTFDQPLSSKFSSNKFNQEQDVPVGNKYGVLLSLSRSPVDGQDVGSLGSRNMTSSTNSAHAVEHVLPRPSGDQYDPLFDSIEPSSKGQKRKSTDDSDTMLRLSGSNKPLDVEENKHKEALTTSLDNDEYGETADAEVGAVENGSPSDPIDEATTPAGEIEIDQVKITGKSKKSKDSRSMKLFKGSLADFVKEVLKPSWRQGNMSKEAFKTIVKKTVDKVSGAMKSHQIPKSQAKINQYIDSSQRKLTKLVMGYVDKYVKL